MKISNLFISVLGAVSAFAATLVAAPTPGSPEGARSALASVVEPGRGSHPSKRRDPWNKWAKNPITVRLSLQANNVYAATNSTVEITLADSHLTVNGRSCTDLTNSAPSGVNMNLRREYLLTVVATNLQSMEMDLQVQPNWQPISTSGKDEAPTDYSLWVDRSPGSTITGGQVYASTNCNYYSNVWRIEIRDEKLFHWYADDNSDDPSFAPGDGTGIEIGPGKSLNTNQTALDWSVGVGRLFDGAAAGRLRIRETGLSRRIYTPTNLYFTASSTNVRGQVQLVTSSADGVLRQVKAYQTFVDIIAVSDQTTLNFYRPSQVATNKDQNGVYTNITGSPFVAWLIQNPEPSTTNKLYIIETRNGVSLTNSLVYTPASTTNTWTLNRGTGPEQRVETRGVNFSFSPTTNRLETVSIKYASSNTPAYKCIETYRLYDWGWELAQTQVDPDNSNLTNTFEYYTNLGDSITYGRPSIFRYPDGYWEKRLYDHDYLLGALQYILRPDKSSPADPTNATTDNCYATEYFYDLDYLRLSTIRHFYGGTVFPGNAFREDDISSLPAGSFMDSIEGRYVAEDGTYTLGTHTISADEFELNGLANHALSQSDSKGPYMAMYYHGGTYDANSRTFTTNATNVADGPDWRQSVLYYLDPA